MLHITNGDCAGNLLCQTDLPGELLLWKDVLEEGPAPVGLSLEQMSQVRAQFIAENGWGTYEAVYNVFTDRDRRLAQFHEHEEVVLWFEHDLHDQLQMIQILDWFTRQDLGKTRISLICINAFPEIEPFRGLGQLNPAQMHSLYPTRREIGEAELNLACIAWKAYCSPEPTALEALIHTDTSALPFLKAALGRHLEQFPAVSNGLSRTERQILEAIAEGLHKPVELFRANLAKEESLLIGDVSFWDCLRLLSSSPTPLLRLSNGNSFSKPGECRNFEEFREQTLVLAELGCDVLARQADWVITNGIDRWLGGVHLCGENTLWRWDEQHQKLIQELSLSCQ